jgi:hypothetical protein
VSEAANAQLSTPASTLPRRRAKVFLVLFLQKKNGLKPALFIYRVCHALVRGAVAAA